MGYNTTYQLELEPENPAELVLIHHKEKRLDSGYASALDEWGHTADSCKWYEWEKDMRRISIEHPDYLFHLHGEGDETGDIWDATFKNGKAHIREAEIKIEPFDPDKLE